MAAKRYASKSPSKAKALALELEKQLNDTITTLVSSEAWPKLLASMAKKNGTEISRYSFQNMLLLLMQCPEASAVCSFNAWIDRGRSPVKGSTSLRIYAPIQVTDRNPDKTIKKDRDGKTKTYTAFRMIPVFDISQTAPIWQDASHGAALTITPALPRKKSVVKQLQGAAPAEMWDGVAGQITGLGYTIERGNTGDGMGYTVPKTKTVRVSDAVSDAQAVKTLAHELGHILADHVADWAKYVEHKGASETVAESFAYMVSAYYGMDTAQYSAPYIGVWAGKDPEEVGKALQACGKQALNLFRGFVAAVESPELERETALVVL